LRAALGLGGAELELTAPDEGVHELKTLDNHSPIISRATGTHHGARNSNGVSTMWGEVGGNFGERAHW